MCTKTSRPMALWVYKISKNRPAFSKDIICAIRFILIKQLFYPLYQYYVDYNASKYKMLMEEI